MDFFMLQLADSAFPAGGFAHSGGLEAAWQQGEVATLSGYVAEVLWQAGHGALPLVGAAHDGAAISGLDARCDVFLSNPVANRASRAQGRAFLSTCARCFPQEAGIAALREQVRAERLRHHHAPVFGAALRALGIGRSEAQGLFLFLAMRGAVSAAVRLGMAGPHEAQGVQRRAGEELLRVLACCAEIPVEELAQTAPVLDLFHGTHDRLYARLFQT